MSHLEFKAYDGVGKQNAEQHGYMQTVKVGDLVYISGQGGWIRDAVPYSIPSSQFGQIDQAFLNIQTALADGGATFDHVFKVVSLHTELNDEVNGYMTEKFREYMPTHKPLWTTMGVTKLGEAQMKVEIEVIAHVPAK